MRPDQTIVSHLKLGSVGRKTHSYDQMCQKIGYSLCPAHLARNNEKDQTNHINLLHQLKRRFHSQSDSRAIYFSNSSKHSQFEDRIMCTWSSSSSIVAASRSPCSFPGTHKVICFVNLQKCVIRSRASSNLRDMSWQIFTDLNRVGSTYVHSTHLVSGVDGEVDRAAVLDPHLGKKLWK